jgi:hypothetical protein
MLRDNFSLYLKGKKMYSWFLTVIIDIRITYMPHLMRSPDNRRITPKSIVKPNDFKEITVAA